MQNIRCNEKEQNIQETKMNRLNHFVCNYKIIMDTSSLMCDETPLFIEYIIPYLKKEQKNIIITNGVLEELYELQMKKEKPEVAERARNAMKQLICLQEKNCIELWGDGKEAVHKNTTGKKSFSKEGLADEEILNLFQNYSSKYKMLLITQAKELSRGLLLLRQESEGLGKCIQVKRINRDGFPSDVITVDKNTDSKENSQAAFTRRTVESQVKRNTSFRICTEVSKIEDKIIPVTVETTTGSTIYTENGTPISLTERLSGGGEGDVYLTNTDSDYVAKIYHPNKNTVQKMEKIKRILQKGYKHPGICFPVRILYNVNKEPVGYLMPKAEGKEIQKSIFVRPVFQKHFPDWKRNDLVRLCITILEKVKYLHDRNILIGDINARNILFTSPDDVWFVDTDSYQIEDLPCTVGTVNFTAPEIQGKKYSEFLRTKGNENFALATLLFMLLLPGKLPYAQQGGGVPEENIKKMEFPYPHAGNSRKTAPEGLWRNMWSHLSYDMKDNFYNTFQKDGKYSNENTRLTVMVWLREMNAYLKYLKRKGNDSQANEIYPTHLKLVDQQESGKKFGTCIVCKEKVYRYELNNRVCKHCQNQAITEYECEYPGCSKILCYTYGEKYVERKSKQRYCNEHAQMEKERKEKERQEKERQEKERKEKERQEKERKEKERREKERQEKERKEKERREKEKVEREKEKKTVTVNIPAEVFVQENSFESKKREITQQLGIWDIFKSVWGK